VYVEESVKIEPTPIERESVSDEAIAQREDAHLKPNRFKSPDPTAQCGDFFINASIRIPPSREAGSNKVLRDVCVVARSGATKQSRR